jgi:lipopolysaccharide/colanic/teichoic acid biosynthesis glycosyltransferase
MSLGSEVLQVEPLVLSLSAAPDKAAAWVQHSWYESGKRAVDVVLALVLLIVTAPLVGLAMLLVKLTSQGPVLYSQTRLGRGGQPFTLYKIRTMMHDCERETGACWATPGDPRITGVGRRLRAAHVDELPQLWNVQRGEMSLIGPRPERPEFAVPLGTLLPYYRDRLLVLPGLTGLGQVQLPADTDLESVRRKLAYDLYYVYHGDPWLDLRLLAATACKLLHLPVSVTRILLCLPGGEPVERAYQRLAALNGSHV